MCTAIASGAKRTTAGAAGAATAPKAVGAAVTRAARRAALRERDERCDGLCAASGVPRRVAASCDGLCTRKVFGASTKASSALRIGETRVATLADRFAAGGPSAAAVDPPCGIGMMQADEGKDKNLHNFPWCSRTNTTGLRYHKNMAMILGKKRYRCARCFRVHN